MNFTNGKNLSVQNFGGAKFLSVVDFALRNFDGANIRSAKFLAAKFPTAKLLTANFFAARLPVTLARML